MKVLIATPLYPPEIGGPATFTKVAEELLPQQGIELIIVKFGEVRHLPKIVRHIAYFWRVYKAARDADVVLALDPVSVGLPAAVAAILRGKFFVVRIVGDYAWEQGVQRFGITQNLDQFAKNPQSHPVVSLFRVLQTFVAKRAVRIIAPSEYLKGIIAQWGIPSEKIEVVYNAFNPPITAITKEAARTKHALSGTILLSVGRLVPWKGFKTLIEILPDIQKEVPDVSLIIAGDGDLESELKKDAPRNVLFVGRLDQATLFEYVVAADLFVLNTGYEGLSHQLLEVMSLGTPIVTTNVGGNSELIESGTEGILVPYDDRAALKEAVVRVIRSGSNTVEAAKTKAAGLTKERMTQHLGVLLKGVTE